MIKKKEFSDNLLVLVIPAAIGIEGNQYQSGLPFTLGSNTETKEVARIERPLGKHRRTQLQLNST